MLLAIRMSNPYACAFVSDTNSWSKGFWSMEQNWLYSTWLLYAIEKSHRKDCLGPLGSAGVGMSNAGA